MASVTQPFTAYLNIRGKDVSVPGYKVDGATIVVTGRFPRIASIHDETWQDTDYTSSPAQFVEKLKLVGVEADIFTFSQRLPNTKVTYEYAHHLENFAVAPTSDYKDWWENRLPQETRKHVRKAQKLNLVLREVEFNDEFIRGLKEIYDESPIRQGRKFWHYGKPLDVVKRENSSYLDRSILIGAYHGTELVGLLKLVRVGVAAQVMQIISKAAHMEKKPTNALLAKGVETCAAKGIRYLVYGNYIYGKNATGQLTEFKRRNGFEMVLLPRYYVPLNLRGQLALSAGLHLGFRRLLPQALEKRLLDLRTSYYARRSRKAEKSAGK
jgi:hypothetical protein